MKYVSTRGKSPPMTLSSAIEAGLAPDGGLYVPESLPIVRLEDFAGLSTLSEITARVLAPFFEGDPLAPEVPEICRRALDFPVPLRDLRDSTSVLELFHGPTAAFKDVGARFLAECLARIEAINPDPGRARTILVATSGDTGGAVACAFFQRPGIQIGVLFPKGGVSARQEKQLTCWGGNVHSFAVHGTFDDCQRLVKAAFADPRWKKERRLSSANSINIGRLLPQMAYYAAASLEYFRRHGKKPAFIVPSGNLGNSFGALLAKRLGFPIRQVALSTNANRVVPDYLDSGRWEPRVSVPTLANAMDVGNPSNMERILHYYPKPEALRAEVSALSVSDEQIRQTISAGPVHWGEIWCPHTATAVFFRERLTKADWIVVATAHPSKFEAIVEPLIGKSIPVPPALAALLARPSCSTEIEADLAQLKREM